MYNKFSCCTLYIYTVLFTNFLKVVGKKLNEQFSGINKNIHKKWNYVDNVF